MGQRVGGRTCSVAESEPSEEFESSVRVQEGITRVVSGRSGAEEVIEPDNDIKVIEDVDELEIEIEVDVSIGLWVGCAGIFGGFPRRGILGGGLVFESVGGEGSRSVVGAKLGEFGAYIQQAERSDKVGFLEDAHTVGCDEVGGESGRIEETLGEHFVGFGIGLFAGGEE